MKTQDTTVTMVVNDQTAVRKTSIVRVSGLQTGELVLVVGDCDVQRSIVARFVQVCTFAREGW